MNRREFLKKMGIVAGAAALPACNPSVRETNLFAILENNRHLLRGQDGGPFDIEALKKQVAGKFVTVSFGFDECSAYCPVLNSSIAAVGKDNEDKMVSIVINVAPEENAVTQKGRDNYRQTLIGQGVKQPLITLYPNSPRDAALVQRDFIGTARFDDPKKHTSHIGLYGADGRFFSDVDGLAKVDGNLRVNNEAIEQIRARMLVESPYPKSQMQMTP